MSRELNQYEQEHANKILSEIEEYEKVHGKMPQEKKAYFIYRKMGEIYTYKESFLLYPDALNLKETYERLAIVREGILENGAGICGDINEGCIIVMKSAGIDAFLYYWAEGVPFAHVDAGFKVKNNYYHFDLRADLFRIQTGMKTEHFALSQIELYDLLYDENPQNNRVDSLCKMNLQNHGQGFTGIPQETLHIWDEEFGFTYHGLYTDDFFNMLKNETMDSEHCKEFFGTSKPDDLAQKKFEFIMERIGVVKTNTQKQIGSIESNSYYRQLLNSLFTPDEFDKYIVVCNGFIINDKTRIMKRIAVIKKDKENVFYLYNPEAEIYEEIDPKDLINAGILYNNDKDLTKPISEFIDSLNLPQDKSNSDADSR